MKVLWHDDFGVCDKATSNQMVKSKQGAFNSCKTNVLSQGKTDKCVEAPDMMDFNMTQYSKTAVECDSF